MMKLMPLVGAIGPSTVADVIAATTRSGADAILLLSANGQYGHILFTAGQVTAARLGEHTGAGALELLSEWDSGVYTLIRAHEIREEQSNRIVLFGLRPQVVKQLERWLKEAGFESNVVAVRDEVLDVIAFVKPLAVLCSCPEFALGADCRALSKSLHDTQGWSPAIIVLADPARPCGEAFECFRVARSEYDVTVAQDETTLRRQLDRHKPH
jgi:hypothetical protein